MSQENVEVARHVWKVFSSRGLEAALESYDEWFAVDCVFEDFPDMPDRATYRGKEGVRGRTTHFAEIWGDFVMEPNEFIDAGDDVVIAMIDMTGRGKGSGAPLNAQAIFVYEFDSGLIVRDRAFTSRGRALEAAGLSE
jgi:ketosteroid isomerase-like protein